MKSRIFITVLLITFTALQAQEQKKSIPSSEKKILMDSVTRLSDQKKYNEAIELLVEVQKEYPEDDVVSSLLRSVERLKKLETGEKDKVDDNQAENYEDLENPDFKITSRKEESIKDPLSHRNSFALDISHSLFTNFNNNPFIPYNYHDQGQTAFRSGLNFNYFLSPLKKLIGFQAGYEGVFFSFDSESTNSVISHQLHLGVLLRTILFEELESSLIFTINGGAGILFNRPFNLETASEEQYIKVWPFIYISLYLEDPLFYHLFQWKKMQNIILFGGIRFNYAFKPNSTEGYSYGAYSFGLKIRMDHFIPAFTVTFEDNDFSDWESVNWGAALSLEIRF